MIAAVIVLYYPDGARLEALLRSLSGQVDHVFAVDNTPGPLALSQKLREILPAGIAYIPLGDNQGIAEAQNVGIQAGIEAGCSHVLLLDQDSALSPGMVTRLLAAEDELLRAGEQVAAVGPQYVDEKTGQGSYASHHTPFKVRKIFLDPASTKPVETDAVMASGSVIRTAVLQSIGMMRGDLFIGMVDIEWGLRARSQGYKSYCVPGVIMQHNLGESVVRFLGRNLFMYSDLRMYYALRNCMYLLKLRTMGWQWRAYMAPRIPYYFLLFLLLSQDKLRNTPMFLRAVWDGALGRLGGRCDANRRDWVFKGLWKNKSEMP